MIHYIVLVDFAIAESGCGLKDPPRLGGGLEAGIEGRRWSRRLRGRRLRGRSL